MQAEMPMKYWSNLPEAALIPSLLQEAPRRVEAMVKRSASKAAAADETEWRPAPGAGDDRLARSRSGGACLHRVSFV
jgi:DNA polymerase